MGKVNWVSKMGLLFFSFCLIFSLTLSLTSVSNAQGTIQFMHIESGDSEAIIRAAVERFEKAHPSYKVDLVNIQPSENRTVVQIALGGGNPPDIFRTQGGGSFMPYIEANNVADLTDLLHESGYIEKFPESVFEVVKQDDRYFAVPGNGSSAAVIWYNSDIFKEHEIEVPKTWEDFKDTVKVLQSKGFSAPIALANRERWPGSEWFEYLVMRFGGSELLSNAADNVAGFDFYNEAFVKAGQELQELVDMGAFNRGFNSASYDLGESRRLLYTERAVMQLMGNWEYRNVISENPDWAEKMDYFTFPAVEGGLGDPSSILGMAAQDFYAVAAASDHIEMSFKLLQYVYDEEAVQARVRIGEVPPVIGADKYIEDPISSRIQKDIMSANYVQQWGDKLMTPQMAEEHLDLIQALFDRSISPEDYGIGMEKLRDLNN